MNDTYGKISQMIMSEYDVPELIFVDHRNAGPDEELFFFKDKMGNEYGLWVRDYMSELEYEANTLKNEFGINVEKWIELKNPTAEEKYLSEYNGDSCALFCVK